jgi:hypothetical protein
VGIRSLGPAIGYHGCSKAIADSVLLGSAHLGKSNNAYDWLGHGAYFWLDSPLRALEWAKQTGKPDAAVVGAIINPGLCLNLADVSAIASLKKAFSVLSLGFKEANRTLPVNSSVDANGLALRRVLDCSVIELLHRLREEEGDHPYDSVLGVFE